MFPKNVNTTNHGGIYWVQVSYGWLQFRDTWYITQYHRKIEFWYDTSQRTLKSTNQMPIAPYFSLQSTYQHLVPVLYVSHKNHHFKPMAVRTCALLQSKLHVSLIKPQLSVHKHVNCPNETFDQANRSISVHSRYIQALLSWDTLPTQVAANRALDGTNTRVLWYTQAS
jgi:hypothetical protein